MRLLLSGAGGFVGEAVVSYFSGKGHEVIPIKRKSPEVFDWKLSDFSIDAVIHLAGEPIFGHWTKEKKRRILLSRSIGTMNLVSLFLQHPPPIFISASAVGFYGDRGEELLQETSSAGVGFLSTVCQAWENAVLPLEKVGTRVVRTRFGVVIGEGGLVQKCRPAFRLGLGGPLGSGEQWLSWISLDDLVRALHFCIEEPELRGAVNLVSPYPLRQKDFAAALGKSLHRPSFFSIPAWLLKLIFGQMAKELLLSSQHVLPKKLQKAHFSFFKPHLQEALCLTPKN